MVRDISEVSLLAVELFVVCSICQLAFFRFFMRVGDLDTILRIFRVLVASAIFAFTNDETVMEGDEGRGHG